jgi:hypothetical protein
MGGIPANQLDRIVPRDSTIAISVTEGSYLSGDLAAPALYIHQFTDRIYGGYNYAVSSSVATHPGTIQFRYDGIAIPRLVADALGPANSWDVFSVPIGAYEITFADGDQTDTYELIVTDSTLSVIAESTSISHPTHNLFWRYRPNSMALYCGTLTETSYVCDDIVDSLLAHVTLEEYFYPDSGVAPYARTSMGHYYDAPARFFLYQQEDDFLEVGAVLERFVQTHRSELNGVGIWVVNWLNESYMSWKMID